MRAGAGSSYGGGSDPRHTSTQAKAASSWLAARTPLASLGADECVRPYTSLVFVQQHALCLFRIYRAVEELVVFEEDLDERGARRDRALDQRLGQRVFDVLLQRSA